MYLDKLQLYNFRNYEERFFQLSHGINCIVGKNGSGKTNLLDALYFLSLCKSSIHSQDQLAIKFGEDFSIIEGFFQKEEKVETITCTIQRVGKKVVMADKKPYEKLADHIGKYPVVLIAPNDTDLVRDGAETRRKLFDGILSQVSAGYLQNYLQYNKALDQRNSLLKQFAEQNYFDAELLDIYTGQVLALGNSIFESRKAFVASFLPFFLKNYAWLSESSEVVGLEYLSDLKASNFDQIFQESLNRDLAAQRTTRGVHKDDYEFMMDGVPIKKFGSQGQKKTFVMAIKLAQYEWLAGQKDTQPILLLDDIFDKLDNHRINRLLGLISREEYGQVFITDARLDRTRELLEDYEVNYIEVEK